MREAIKIMRQLIMKGSINDRDAREKQRLTSEYETLKSTYKNSDDWIAKIISFIHFEDIQTYEKCCYLYSQLVDKKNVLHNQIQILNTTLQHIEDNRNHMIKHISEHAELLYEEVKSISNHSYVTLQGKKRRTLEIVLPDKLDNSWQKRIENFVDQSISDLRHQLFSEDIPPAELYNKISGIFSDRAMFNRITGKEHIQIRIWKTLEDERNSRLEKWESRYSDGEHFIIYVILYSALAAYTRRKQTAESTDKIKSVFLIDNPFGKTSSEHLVDALIKITQTFNLQLICLSDLKQSSITNNFNLIYQLSMRKAVYSNQSQLNIDHITNNTNANKNSHLEFVSLKSQMSFFD